MTIENPLVSIRITKEGQPVYEVGSAMLDPISDDNPMKDNIANFNSGLLLRTFSTVLRNDILQKAFAEDTNMFLNAAPDANDDDNMITARLYNDKDDDDNVSIAVIVGSGVPKGMNLFSLLFSLTNAMEESGHALVVEAVRKDNTAGLNPDESTEG